MFANFKTLLRMTKPLYVIAAVCLWIFSSCQSTDYKYEAVYRNLPMQSMPFPNKGEDILLFLPVFGLQDQSY